MVSVGAPHLGAAVVVAVGVAPVTGLSRLLTGLLGSAPLAGLGLSGLGRLLLRGRLTPLAGLLRR